MKEYPLDAAMEEFIDFLERDLKFMRESLQQINGALLEKTRNEIIKKNDLLKTIHYDYELSSPHFRERVKDLIREHRVLLSLYI
ncbi:hypothetical protein [Vibrio crassostreae]|jgi:hypothetical protein|uniref:hypothetical protein n=1 Tax=Vibrio crassostreae TaxID=246167 RepID=UPI001B30AA35|nr:hypothetical protein [Vibrio crassostreae]